MQPPSDHDFLLFKFIVGLYIACFDSRRFVELTENSSKYKPESSFNRTAKNKLQLLHKSASVFPLGF